MTKWVCCVQYFIFPQKKGSLGSSWGGGGSRLDRKKLIKSEKILFYIHKQQPKTQQVKQE